MNINLGPFGSWGVDKGPQRRKSFAGSGATDPRTMLANFMAQATAHLNDVTSRGPFQLHGVVPQGPAPVSIPGLPFQIGGGLGHDPAIDDPSILMARAPSQTKPRQAAPTDPQSPPNGVRVRQPQ